MAPAKARRPKPKTKAGKKPAARKRSSPAKKAAPKTKTRAKSSLKPRPKQPPAAPVYGSAPLIADEGALTDAMAALLARDPERIGPMLDIAGAPPLRARAPGFSGLVGIIISQQVSVASATAIHGRLEAAFDPLDARTIRFADDAHLRACGLSGPKIRTLRALAEAVDTRTIDLERLGDLPAPDAHAALVAIHGIGPWTADIFLLFCLGHPDAWPVGDIALQEAARIALGLRTRPDARRLERIGERWRPHRGVAARLLWAYYRVVKARKGFALA
jgi:DNA-3-methyladenine glycosylase II